MTMERIAALRRFLQNHTLDSVIMLQPENLKYFSGFTGGEGALVLTPSRVILWTDSRYIEQAVDECTEKITVMNHGGRLAFSAVSVLIEDGAGAVGYERDFMTHSFFESMAQEDELYFEAVSLQELRAVKETYEIEATRRASRIADMAFAELLPHIRPGVTERQLAALLESKMLLAGSEEKSFDTIVASGKRSAMPHGTATDKPVENGDFITFDFGAVCDGYHSDMTRTVVCGKASEEQKRFYDLVLQSQLIGVDAVKSGASCYETDAAVRQFFAKHGVDKYFTHALGHGTGLEIHEQPVLSPRSQGVLKENMIVTVEPGLYIEGKYGVRIEDSLVVTAEGCEILTTTSKELTELF